MARSFAAGSTNQQPLWLPPGTDGRTAAFGMTIDARGRLLVCGWHSGEVFAYQTATGGLAAWHVVRPTPRGSMTCASGPIGARPDASFLNAIIVDPTGTALLVAARQAEVLTEGADLSVHFWLTAARLDHEARTGKLAGRWPRRIQDAPTTLAHIAGRLYLVNSQIHPERQGTPPGAFTISAVDLPA